MITLKWTPPNAKGLGAEALEAQRPLVRRFVQSIIIDLVNRIKRKVGGVGTGRIYKRGKNRTHRASAPGMPPARDFGGYVNSWVFETHETKAAITARVGSTLWAKIGILLEFGTRRMRPRPHIGPVMEEWTKSVNDKISRFNSGGSL